MLRSGRLVRNRPLRTVLFIFREAMCPRRVNRRLQLRVGRGRVQFEQNGADDIRVIPETLTELPALHGYADTGALRELAARYQVADRV